MDVTDLFAVLYDVIILAVIVFLAIVVISFFAGFIKAWREASAKVQERKIASNKVTLQVDVIVEKGVEMFLLYEHPSLTFAFQANSAEEVAKKLLDNYKDKYVHLLQDGEERVIETFTRA